MPDELLSQCEFDSGNLLVKVDETLPGDVNAIAPFIEKVMAIVKEMGCAAGREYEIELALNEALTNAIKYGSCHDPSKPVQCCVACDYTRGMLIIVRDQGPGFDPASIPDPVIGQNVYSSSGRGIYLINQLVDEVRFEKGGTEIHIVVRSR